MNISTTSIKYTTEPDPLYFILEAKTNGQDINTAKHHRCVTDGQSSTKRNYHHMHVEIGSSVDRYHTIGKTENPKESQHKTDNYDHVNSFNEIDSEGYHHLGDGKLVGVHSHEDYDHIGPANVAGLSDPDYGCSSDVYLNVEGVMILDSIHNSNSNKVVDDVEYYNVGSKDVSDTDTCIYVNDDFLQEFINNKEPKEEAAINNDNPKVDTITEREHNRINESDIDVYVNNIQRRVFKKKMNNVDRIVSIPEEATTKECCQKQFKNIKVTNDNLNRAQKEITSVYDLATAVE